MHRNARCYDLERKLFSINPKSEFQTVSFSITLISQNIYNPYTVPGNRLPVFFLPFLQNLAVITNILPNYIFAHPFYIYLRNLNRLPFLLWQIRNICHLNRQISLVHF